jgi:tRNA threonylcarbamoyladenosine biosynthesis protein TsaB
MLMLALRTDKQEAELYLYDGDKKLGELKWQAHRQLAETLNQKIDQLLTVQGRTLYSIEKVGVYLGPGSFTALRIGISVANTLAYGLGVPIVGATDDEWLDYCLQNSGSNVPVVPEYGSEPHITQQKK